jgi:PAS domain S-box-containing protein
LKRKGTNLTNRRKPRGFREHEQLQHAIQKDQAYKTVVEKAVDFIYLIDKRNNVLSVNKSAAALFGRTPKEIEGKSIFQLFPKEVATEFAEHLSEVFETGKGRLESDSRIVVEGKEFWTNVRLDPVTDRKGRVLAVLGVTRDITERKRVEERLAFQASLLDQVRNSVIAIDLSGRVVYLNKRAETLYRWKAAEAIGRPVADLIVNQIERKLAEDIMKEVEARGYWEGEFTVKRKDGTTFPVHVVDTVIRDTEGKTVGIAGVSVDITERRRMEERLSSLHEHSLKLASATRMDEIVKYTLDTMRFTLGFDYADFMMVEDGLLVAKVVRGEIVSFSVPLGGPGIMAKAAREKKSIRVNDTREDRNYIDRKGPGWKGPSTTFSEIATPVIIDGQTAAVLNVEHAQPNAFSEQDQTLLENLAAHVASEMKRLEHQRQLENYANELRRSSQFLGSIIENANVWLDVLDNENKVVIWNKAAETMSGYFRGEVVGHRKVWEWLYPDEEYRKQITDSVTDILQQGRAEQDIETSIKRKDGQARIISWNERALVGNDGEIIGSIAIGRDVTEQKQMQEQLEQYSKHLEELVEERSGKLAESERRFRELANLLPQIVFETDARGNYTFVNRSGMAAAGYTEEEVYGGLNAVQTFIEGDREKIKKSIERILTGKDVHPHEFTALRKDGTTFPVMIHSTAIIHEGKAVGVRGVAMDITERKRLEERLVRSEHMAAIGETAAMVGHDLRNPLQGITGAIHLLNQESLTAKERSEMLQLIQDNVEYADAIVRDLSAYSAEIHLKLTDTTPKSIVEEALRGVRVPREVAVQDVSEEHPTIKVDSDQMRRVLINLIENSIDAMPQGGTLTISSKQSDDAVEIALSDTGSGMSEKVMQNLWKPLQTTKAKGLGLGLAICKRIVDAHGGIISVKSRVGEGTTVTIRLPIKPDATEVTQK